jgi:Fe-S oxidoreductase
MWNTIFIRESYNCGEGGQLKAWKETDGEMRKKFTKKSREEEQGKKKAVASACGMQQSGRKAGHEVEESSLEPMMTNSNPLPPHVVSHHI